MPIDPTAFGRDMTAIIGDQPISCQFGDVQFVATVGETRRSNDVQAEGILNLADLEIMALVADLGGSDAVPNVQQVITVDGTKYHIAERVIEPFGVSVHFILRRV
jgi:hypothetical protein